MPAMASARPREFDESIIDGELGAGRNRTGDARLRTAALYPLSYSPKRLRRFGLLRLCQSSEASEASDADTARDGVMTKA